MVSEEEGQTAKAGGGFQPRVHETSEFEENSFSQALKNGMQTCF